MSAKNIPIVAFKLGENVQIENLKKAYKGEIYASSPFEVFIQLGEYSFICIQRNGEIACSDCDELIVSNFIEFTIEFIDIPINSTTILKKKFTIEFKIDAPQKFLYNSLQTPKINVEIIQIILLNVNQSICLDYFTKVTSEMLIKTKIFSKELEIRGKLKISKSNLMKFIGETLYIQNQFVDVIYHNDEPQNSWNDESLMILNERLSKTFKLKQRFREVECTLKIIDLNLKTFAQFIQHRENHKMEWVIIILIFCELLNIIFKKHN